MNATLGVVGQDLRHAMRVLRNNVGYSTVAIVTLALGIGANTAIFSVVNRVLLKALPYPNPQRLVILDEYRLRHGSRTVSWLDFRDWRGQNQVFDAMAAYRLSYLSLTRTEEPALLRVAEVSSTFFEILGAQAGNGRTFVEQEDMPGAPPMVVVSYGLWKNRLGGDTNVAGKALTLDGVSYSVIGVLPKEFSFFDEPVDAYLPVGLHGAEVEWNQREIHPNLLVLARLRARESIDSARIGMNVIMRRLEQNYPQSNTALVATVTDLHQYRYGNTRTMLFTLFAAVGCILLIACVNVANLLLARGSSRKKEMAVRAALGADRWRLMRQLMTETVALSLLGGFLGVLLGVAGLHIVVNAAPTDIPQLAASKIDGAVLLFTIAVSLMTGLLFGAAPAMQGAFADLNSAFKETSRRSGASRAGKRLRSGLLVAEMAIALVLLTAAGLVIRSLSNAVNVDPGFQAHNLLALDLTLPPTKYVGGSEKAVESVVDLPTAASNIVVPGYFEAMKVPLRDGRFFSDLDTERSRLVAIVNQSFARRYWPNESAIGKRIREGGPRGNQPYRDIVGVAADLKQNGMDAEPRPEVFFPITQFPFAPWTALKAMTFVVRTDGDPLSIAEVAKTALQAADKDLPVTRVRPMTQYMAESLERRRFSTLLLAAFAGLALLLAAVGTYGIMAYNVNQRVHEIGVRMALGATASQIRALVLRDTLLLASLGIVVGWSGSLFSARLLASQLFGVRATDPLTFGCVAALGVIVAGLASYLPMRSAISVDSTTALRSE